MVAGVYVQEVADLNVEVERAGTGAVLRLDGDLDKLTAPLLKQRLVELAGEGCHDIVIDARQLAFCDSSGLWVLVEHQRQVSEHGGSMRLTGVCGVLQRVLDVTGLKAVFDGVLPAQL
ncbi:STAS domain-containing protein [Nonomuraea sp. NN258]|uniref:STAS domain-containing protein n=1 Tax=Nonomuraea antri TaxID=2730852 RepID=UPI001568DDEE|nr:STAS domain-containing protein [Nonomuraea antri]NRQ37489.1 STAS domain-containing protein [Nonomuraea antri]